MHLIIIVVLLLLSALFSGLNLSLMSLGPHELKRKSELGDKRAGRIYPLRKNGNQLLISLLLGNITTISTLSVFLESLTSGLIAVVLSTLLVTIFGEIAPQALFSRYALTVGSMAAPLVKLTLWIFWPLAKPMAWVIDKLLGKELPELYSRAELVKILEEHAESPSSDIALDEERIARGALTFGDKLVKQVMTPRSQIHHISASAKVDEALIKRLKNSGFSRFPVFADSQDEVVGMLYMRVIADPSNFGKIVKDVAEAKVRFVNENDELDHVLKAFLSSKHHLFVVVNEFSEVVGVVSIEDVLEEILDRQIVGEFDQYEDLRAVAKRKSNVNK